MAGAWAGPRGSAPIITMSRLETLVTGRNDEMKLLQLQMEVRENFIILGSTFSERSSGNRVVSKIEIMKLLMGCR